MRSFFSSALAGYIGRRFFFALLCAAVPSVLAAPGQQQRPDATQKACSFEEGDALFRGKKYPAAAAAFRAAIESTGHRDESWTNAWIHIRLGKIFDSTGQRERALNQCHQVNQARDDGSGAQAETDRYLLQRYLPNSIEPGCASTARGFVQLPPAPTESQVKLVVQPIIGDLGIPAAPVAQSEKELQELIRRGERNYYVFELGLGSTSQPVGPVRLELIQSMPGEHQYTILIFANGSQIEKRRRKLHQPVQFFLPGQDAPSELVIYQIEPGRVLGYLSEPKAESPSAHVERKLPQRDSEDKSPTSLSPLAPPDIRSVLPGGLAPGGLGARTETGRSVARRVAQSFPVVHRHKLTRCWGTLTVSSEMLRYDQSAGAGRHSFEIPTDQIATVAPWGSEQFEVQFENGLKYHFAHGVVRNLSAVSLASMELRPREPIIEAIRRAQAMAAPAPESADRLASPQDSSAGEQCSGDRYDEACVGHRDLAENVNLPIDHEIRIGSGLARDVEKQSRILDNAAVVEYVSRVGQNIVRNSDSRVPFTFKILADDSVQLKVLPGGFIYVSRGLVSGSGQENRLASAIAHAVSHVAARHYARGLAHTPSLVRFLEKPLPSEDETDAHLLAVVYIHKAGYDAADYAAFFNGLPAHPVTSESLRRIEDLREHLSERPQVIVTTSEYERMMRRITVQPSEPEVSGPTGLNVGDPEEHVRRFLVGKQWVLYRVGPRLRYFGTADQSDFVITIQNGRVTEAGGIPSRNM